MHLATLNKLAVATVCLSLAMACNSRSKPGGDLDDPGGEPEHYSATVVRSVEDGTDRELSVTRIFKSGDLRRQEWTEQGESYALIWRPDLGKMYALDLERRCYVENETNPQVANMPDREPDVLQSRTPEVEQGVPDSTNSNRDRVTGETVERALGDAPLSDRVETRRLSDKTIDGHSCRVLERREVFFDGSVEVTTTFRANDLGGLVIRIEIGPSEATGGTRLVTRLRDIQLSVPADAFVVPPDFRKVDKLLR